MNFCQTHIKIYKEELYILDKGIIPITYVSNYTYTSCTYQTLDLQRRHAYTNFSPITHYNNESILVLTVLGVASSNEFS